MFTTCFNITNCIFGHTKNLGFSYTVEFHIFRIWLFGQVWSFGQICRKFYKTNLSWNMSKILQNYLVLKYVENSTKLSCLEICRKFYKTVLSLNMSKILQNYLVMKYVENSTILSCLEICRKFYNTNLSWNMSKILQY